MGDGVVVVAVDGVVVVVVVVVVGVVGSGVGAGWIVEMAMVWYW